uniref:DUF4371 domain-containing protein n=1 Tax=Timema shepardi TaxID=629360 RepID=A0A7R9FWK6_TIMSH|nr:unnamed protein product [Timema shepardi]
MFDHVASWGTVGLAAETRFDQERWLQGLREAARITLENSRMGESIIRDLETQGLQLNKEKQCCVEKLHEETIALRDEIDKNEGYGCLAPDPHPPTLPHQQTNRRALLDLQQAKAIALTARGVVVPQSVSRWVAARQLLLNSVRVNLKQTNFMHIPGFGDLPCVRNLRQNFVQPIGEEMKLELKEKVQGVPIVIVVDKTSDSRGRCALAILFRTVAEAATQDVFLVNCLFLDKATGSTVCQAINGFITQYGIEYNNILGLVSDSAQYMETCFVRMSSFSDALIEFLGQYENKNASAEFLLEQQRDPVAWQSVKLQMVFIADSYKMFVGLINKLEGSKFPFAQLFWHELEALMSVLKRLYNGNFSERTRSLLSSITSVAKREELKQLCGCAHKSAMKLAKHMAPRTTNNFFKAAGELFNPAIAAQSLTADEKSVRKQFEVLPLFYKLTSDKCVEGYLYLHKVMGTTCREGKVCDIIQMLMAM